MALKNFDTKRFVIEQGLISSINAAVRRVGIYRKKKGMNKKAFDHEKEKMRKAFAKAIIKAANKIKTAQGDRKNILDEAIESVTKKIKCYKIFKQGQPSFGVAQKAVNLFLKYLWCLDIFKQPPHCPIDSQILKEIKWNSPKKHGTAKKWSTFSKKDYEGAISDIEKVRNESKKSSIATWELAEWKSSLNINENTLRSLLV
jgi:hypothetical protein